ncbi:MFS transporter [Rummeliibacillus sp. G93]|uniref:MFS transporter n=1 Tax=Rummeliibacillus sp. G93 TaxID=2939494 RepID=UPI00201BFA8C|nr:MFS transporter [Rummeliibacillus sp. G93]UQW98690.1 MFS transporter [Rummeliibacillus sp. G93]
MNDSLKLKRATYHLWTFTASKMISTFGAQVYAFAISFYILKMTGSASSFATNLICNILPRTLIGPFAGYIADTYSRKVIVIAAQLVSTVAIFGLLLYSLFYTLSLPAIYITTVILSIASTFSSVGFTSSITGLVDEKRIQKAMSLNQMASSMAAVASPAIGGVLYGAVSIPFFLVIYGVASLLGAIIESTMNFSLFANRNVEKSTKESMFASIKDGISYIRLQPILMAIIWTALLINFFMGALQVGYSFLLIEKLKIISSHFGFIEGAMAAGMLFISGYLAARKEFQSPLIISKRGIAGLGILMSLVTLPLLVPLPYEGMFAFYASLSLLNGALLPLINTPLQVLMMRLIDDDYKGRVFSILETMAMALMPAAMILFGFLYDVLPAPWILFGSSFLLILTVSILMRPSVIRNATTLDQKPVNEQTNRAIS